MKLKNLQAVLAISLLFTLPNVFSQNQNNKIDSTGNIGIGVMNPSSKLQINGNTRIDSALEVRDTATFRRKVRIEEDVVILGKTFMRDNVVASENLRVQNGFRVDGISHFYNNTTVDSTFRVEGLGLFNQNVRVNGQFRSYGINNLFGTSRFHDEVRLLNLTDPSGQNNEGMMFLTGNGKVIRKELEDTDTLTTDYSLLLEDGNGNVKKLGITLKSLVSIAPFEISCATNYTPVWNYDVGKAWIGNGNDNCDIKTGINTTTPLYDLDVNGVTRTKNLKIEFDDGSTPIEVTKGTEKLLTLHPEGYLYAQEVRVRAPGDFPDYVFADDYNLMSLNELKTYISVNKHLPNIPSAAEVEEKGTVNVGEMNTKLLEKVEELTLYILQQEERIQELEEKMDEMNKGGQ